MCPCAARPTAECARPAPCRCAAQRRTGLDALRHNSSQAPHLWWQARTKVAYLQATHPLGASPLCHVRRAWPGLHKRRVPAGAGQTLVKGRHRWRGAWQEPQAHVMQGAAQLQARLFLQDGSRESRTAITACAQEAAVGGRAAGRCTSQDVFRGGWVCALPQTKRISACCASRGMRGLGAREQKAGRARFAARSVQVHGTGGRSVSVACSSIEPYVADANLLVLLLVAAEVDLAGVQGGPDEASKPAWVAQNCWMA